MFKTNMICDRRIFDKKGKWKSPNSDIEENIYYFIKEPLTIASDYRNGQEEMVETMTITIFGGKPIVKEDTITLQDGTTFKVVEKTVNYFEANIMVKDMLKQRIASMELVLE